jgi:multidrug efflux pump subunit AcrB
VNRPIRWFAGHHVAANLLMFLIVVGGLMATTTIKREFFPEIRPDLITVTVIYPGAAPEEVETGICIKIEEEVQSVEGVDRITSSSAEGAGAVTIELLRGTDVSRALDEVKNLVDGVTTFPDEAEEPIVQEVVNRRQVIDVVIAGDADERALRSLGERVRDDITALPGITHVDLVIARPYEVSIEVSETALREYGVTFDEVANAVRRSSLDLPGGSVKTRGGEILLRSIGQAYDGVDFERLVLRSRPDGTRLVLGGVATVIDGFEETGQESYFDAKPAVMVQVFRVGDQNVNDVSRKVHEYIERTNRGLPEGVSLTAWNDDARILKSRLNLLVRNGTAGFFLVFVILALFLKLRLAFWVSLGIPISFLGGIWMMPVLGVSVNMISLFAFIVVLGLAVDDAIVVGESIYWKMERGKRKTEAAAEGTLRVLTPVVFAVLTTVTAFTPLLFIPGTMGQVWRQIPLIVIPVILFSLIECLFVLPAHISRIDPGKQARGGVRAAWQGFQTRFDEGFKGFLRRAYEPSLDFALRWRYLTIAVGVATFLLTVGLVRGGWIKFTFFPQVQAESVVAALTMPLGTPREVTASSVLRIQNAAVALREEVEEEYGAGAVRHVLTSVGEQPFGARQAHGPRGQGGTFVGEHLGEVHLELARGEEIEIDARAVARRWRELAGPIPDAVELTYSSSLFRSGDPLHFDLASNDLGALRSATERLKAVLADFPGVFDIRDSFRSGKSQVELKVKPEAEALGIGQIDLARQVRQAFYGEEAQRIQRGRDDVKVMVRYPEAERRSLGNLEGLRIRGPGGVEVPFATVASVEMGRGFSTIRRVDRQRVISVTADLDTDVANANEIIAQVRANELPGILADHPGVSYSLEGEQRQQTEAMSAMRRGFLVALFVIFALLAVPLRSYAQPLIIMGSIPLGFVGAVWGHMLIGMDLTMLSAAGFVALSGVVVNDSLVMVDFINRSRRKGMAVLEAARTAGVVRFRAILLTSVSTFAGVTPLLLERSLQAQFLKPLAVSLGFGVLFATFLILVILPSSYLVLHDLQSRIGRRPATDEGGPEPVPLGAVPESEP